MRLAMARASSHIWAASCSVATSQKSIAAMWRIAARRAALAGCCTRGPRTIVARWSLRDFWILATCWAAVRVAFPPLPLGKDGTPGRCTKHYIDEVCLRGGGFVTGLCPGDVVGGGLGRVDQVYHGARTSALLIELDDALEKLRLKVDESGVASVCL
jgi:hypothetical protein